MLARYHPSAIIAWLSVALYPFLLQGFHAAAGGESGTLSAFSIVAAAAWLAATFAVPLISLICAIHSADREVSTLGARRALRLCYFGVVAPTAYVFIGVITYMLHSPFPDPWLWVIGWGLIGIWYLRLDTTPATTIPVAQTSARWRVAHGVGAAIITVYVLFHIFNHLFGLVGTGAHAAVMKIGRHVYRSTFVEPMLVLLLLFQIGSGLRLAWEWSARSAQPYRVFQTGSGIYLTLFILGHMNSVFIFARRFLKIDTDWSFATGAPAGLIHDGWNVRLIPHYWLGVFFVLAHLATGLRVVLAAHGVGDAIVTRVWTAGLVASAVIATAILAGMCGVRV